ncbi:MAG: ATP-binding protein [Myxococcales bacterium]
MRLAQRLLISHALLTAGLLGAAAFASVALVRMTALIADVRDQQLGSIAEEELLHQAAWDVEVASRHGTITCETHPEQREAVSDAIRTRLARLEELLRQHGASTQPAIRKAVEGYVAHARFVVEGDTCARLRQTAVREKRLLLDEQLTDAWIGGTRTIHDAIRDNEARASDIGSTAIAVVLVLGTLAIFAAWFVARWMAESVTNPLAALASQARRVGQRDFTPLLPVGGPAEVQELSKELDRMRAGLAEVDHLKDAFVASVSHDLRTPLTRLRTALGLLADGTTGPLNEQQRRVVDLAQRACEREIRLVNAVLDMSRVRSGRPLRRESSCLPDEVLHRAIEDVHAEADSARVKVQLVANGQEIPPATLDPVILERAVVNLLSNAIRVTPPNGTVRLERLLTATPPPGMPAGGQWLQILVHDDGPGVSQEIRSRLFEPFFTQQVGPARGGPEGVGLGLPLAREMARAHGGELDLLERPGPGATFSLWVPHERGAQPPSQSRSFHVPLHAPPAVGPRAGDR